jgi:hypothetical protein
MVFLDEVSSILAAGGLSYMVAVAAWQCALLECGGRVVKGGYALHDSATQNSWGTSH